MLFVEIDQSEGAPTQAEQDQRSKLWVSLLQSATLSAGVYNVSFF